MAIQMRQETTYVSAAETGKLIRAALKAAYPSIKFSVRTSTYSGGASANIGWTDGPTEKQITALLSQYQGATFDGMIDLQSAVYHQVDGRRVHYGTDYIFCKRITSRELVAACMDEACAVYGKERAAIIEDTVFGAYVEVGSAYDYWDLPQLVTRYLQDTDATKRCTTCGYYRINTEVDDEQQPARSTCRACKEAF